jgi:hypothetical protein
MKKYITLVALLAVGCSSSAQVASTTPTPEIVEAPAIPQANQYVGVLEFLAGLLTLAPAEFEELCAETGGNFDTSANYYTCVNGVAGFSIQHTAGFTKGAAVMVPATEGKALAEALYEAAGEPTFTAENSAMWEAPGFTIVFGPVGSIAYMVILERVGTSL